MSILRSHGVTSSATPWSQKNLQANKHQHMPQEVVNQVLHFECLGKAPRTSLAQEGSPQACKFAKLQLQHPEPL